MRICLALAGLVLAAFMSPARRLGHREGNHGHKGFLRLGLWTQARQHATNLPGQLILKGEQVSHRACRFAGPDDPAAACLQYLGGKAQGSVVDLIGAEDDVGAVRTLGRLAGPGEIRNGLGGLGGRRDGADQGRSPQFVQQILLDCLPDPCICLIDRRKRQEQDVRRPRGRFGREDTASQRQQANHR